MKHPAVYILASGKNGTLYVGVTSDLVRRVGQHREGRFGGFAARYGVMRLVWWELLGTMEAAILREKQIKGGARAAKISLIEVGNPEWADLYYSLL